MGGSRTRKCACRGGRSTEKNKGRSCCLSRKSGKTGKVKRFGGSSSSGRPREPRSTIIHTSAVSGGGGPGGGGTTVIPIVLPLHAGQGDASTPQVRPKGIFATPRVTPIPKGVPSITKTPTGPYPAKTGDVPGGPGGVSSLLGGDFKSKAVGPEEISARDGRKSRKGKKVRIVEDEYKGIEHLDHLDTHEFVDRMSEKHPSMGFRKPSSAPDLFAQKSSQEMLSSDLASPNDSLSVGSNFQNTPSIVRYLEGLPLSTGNRRENTDTLHYSEQPIDQRPLFTPQPVTPKKGAPPSSIRRSTGRTPSEVWDDFGAATNEMAAANAEARRVLGMTPTPSRFV